MLDEALEEISSANRKWFRRTPSRDESRSLASQVFWRHPPGAKL